MPLKKNKVPDPFVEVFLCLFKWFVIVLLLNNAIWATVFLIATSTSEETVELTQDGTSNTQGINNGTIG